MFQKSNISFVLVVLSMFIVSCGNDASFSSTSTTAAKNASQTIEPASTEVDQTSAEESNGNSQDAVIDVEREGDVGNPEEEDSGLIIEDGLLRFTQDYTGIATSPNTPGPDIMFLVDTSGSMSQEKQYLENAIAAFMNDFVNLDLPMHQVYMVGQDFRFPETVKDLPNFSTVNARINSTDALYKFLDIVDGDISLDLPLRADAPKEVIVVTDDNSALSATAFLDQLSARNINNVSVSGLVGLKAGVNTPTCTIASVGTVYQQLAVTPDKKGLIQDVCNNNWNALLKNLAKYIISKILQTNYKLDKVVASEENIEVKVDGQLLDRKQYEIDKDKNEIVFSPDYAPKEGVPFSVSYLTFLED